MSEETNVTPNPVPVDPNAPVELGPEYKVDVAAEPIQQGKVAVTPDEVEALRAVTGHTTVQRPGRMRDSRGNLGDYHFHNARGQSCFVPPHRVEQELAAKKGKARA